MLVCEWGFCCLDPAEPAFQGSQPLFLLVTRESRSVMDFVGLGCLMVITFQGSDLADAMF